LRESEKIHAGDDPTLDGRERSKRATDEKSIFDIDVAVAWVGPCLDAIETRREGRVARTACFANDRDEHAELACHLAIARFSTEATGQRLMGAHVSTFERT